ncbi:MAG TPA: hypothetical protein VIT89_03825 [Solirubrobacterales bacterium]
MRERSHKFLLRPSAVVCHGGEPLLFGALGQPISGEGDEIGRKVLAYSLGLGVMVGVLAGWAAGRSATGEASVGTAA